MAKIKYIEANKADLNTIPISPGNMIIVKDAIPPCIYYDTLDNVRKSISNLESINTQLSDMANNKVDKMTGKGLSTNDYDDIEKAEVAKVKTKAEQNTADSLQNQINGLVVGSGTSSAEVVQARVGLTGATYATIYNKNKNTDNAVNVLFNNTKFTDLTNISSTIFSTNKAGYRFNTDGTEISDGDWNISDYLTIDRPMNLTAYAWGTRVAIVLCDTDKNIIKTINNPSGADAINTITATINPIDCAFARMTSFRTTNICSYSYYQTTSEKLADLNNSCKKDTNIIRDKILYTIGKELASDGSLRTDSNYWYTSDFILIDRNMTITGYSGGGTQNVIALYDSSKNIY